MTTSDLEQDLHDLDSSVTNGIRAAFGVSGLLALVIGVVILVWPVKTAVVVAGIIATWAVIAGVVNLAVGIFSRKLRGWPRVGYLALGLVFLAAAVLAFANLNGAATGLAIMLGVVVGVVWIVEGVVALTMIGDSASKVWTIIYAVLSILACISLITSPLWGAALLWLILSISLVILGIVQIVRAIRFGRT